MDIVVKGRHTEVTERFRTHVAEKLAKLEKLDPKVISIDVECSQERNPRLADQRERVELTIRSRGPVIRAEAAAQDCYAALDVAGHQARGPAAQGAGPAPGAPRREDPGLGRRRRPPRLDGAGRTRGTPTDGRRAPTPGADDDGPMFVREKVHRRHR